ncbi:hypothetical protein FZW96_21400 [Bacillus sp. BGMRC 2118]|nr:hypothetical protein FZW96_21400 [Bacillus sp. BGMRC 2118]
MIFNGLPLVIFAIAGALFWAAKLPKIKGKKLTFVMIGLGVNVATTPLALFIGIMATDSPTSTMLNFWAGFFFIQGIPLLLLVIVIVKWCIDMIKK